MGSVSWVCLVPVPLSLSVARSPEDAQYKKGILCSQKCQRCNLAPASLSLNCNPQALVCFPFQIPQPLQSMSASHLRDLSDPEGRESGSLGGLSPILICVAGDGKEALEREQSSCGCGEREGAQERQLAGGKLIWGSQVS